MSQNKQQKYLKLWGFKEADYEATYPQLGLSKKIIKYLEEYINHFPSTRGLAFIGNAKISTKTMGRTVKEIMDKGGFKNRVSIIDIPSYLTSFSSVGNQERVRSEGKIKEDLINSDLVILQELGLTKWNDMQKTKLYTLIYERYSRDLPIFTTVSCELDNLEAFIGGSNLFRIEDSCSFLELTNNG